MPISVILTDEDGEEVERLDDVGNLLHRLLPSVDDGSYQYLRFIDWYGDTVFNQLQIEPFISEWARLEAAATAPEDKQLLSRISNLAKKCQAEPHLFLKFEGD
jgi:hypothetical protein